MTLITVSEPKVTRSGNVTLVESLTGGQRLFQFGTTTDNSSSDVTNPLLSAQVSATVLALPTSAGAGRLLRIPAGVGSVAFYPLVVSSASDTMVCQIWRIHAYAGTSTPVPAIDIESLKISFVDNASRDFSHAATTTFTSSASLQTLSFDANAVAYHDSTSGTAYNVGEPFVFDTLGAAFFLPTIKTRGTSASLLAKFIASQF